MIRGDLTAGSAQGMMMVTPGLTKGNNFQRRVTANGVSTGTTGAFTGAPAAVDPDPGAATSFPRMSQRTASRGRSSARTRRHANDGVDWFRGVEPFDDDAGERDIRQCDDSAVKGLHRTKFDHGGTEARRGTEVRLIYTVERLAVSALARWSPHKRRPGGPATARFTIGDTAIRSTTLGQQQLRRAVAAVIKRSTNATATRLHSRHRGPCRPGSGQLCNGRSDRRSCGGPQGARAWSAGIGVSGLHGRGTQRARVCSSTFTCRS